MQRVVFALIVLAFACWTSVPWAVVAAQSDAAAPAHAAGNGEGWFTEEQADRGAESYAAHCAQCHSPDLQARSTYISLYGYPALVGTYFMDRWRNQSVLTLFEVIQHTMPLDAPNTLDAGTYADITAHVLRENGFPAGGSELPTAQEGRPRLDGLIIEPGAAEPQAAAQDPDVVELRPRDEDAEGGEGEEEGGDQGGDGQQSEDESGASVDGGALYSQHCAQCHGEEGEGGAGPALAGDEFLADAVATVDQILHGGGGMPAFEGTLSDAEVAAVATHVRTAWGNDFGEVSEDDVAARGEEGEGGDGESAAGSGDASEGGAEDEEPAPWYAEAQADRGRIAFMESCARCHGRALQGTGAAPSLAGANFIARWEGESLDDLYFVVSALMPLDAPGSLEPETYTDLLAYVLHQNGFEAGDDELPTDTAALGRYVIRPDLADVPDVQ